MRTWLRLYLCYILVCVRYVHLTAYRIISYQIISSSHHTYLYALHPLLGRVLRDLLRDESGHRAHVPRAVVVRGNHRVDDVLVAPLLRASRELLVQDAKARSARGDRELGVERQDHQGVDLVLLDRLERRLGEGVPVSHPHVALGAAQPPALQLRGDGLSLRVGPRHDRRTSADALVRALALGRPEDKNKG